MSEQLPLFPDLVIMEEKPKKEERYEELDAANERIVIGGIYIPKDSDPEDPETEFCVSFGRGLHLLWDGIFDIDSDVEIGGFHHYKLLRDYSLGYNKQEKYWRIRDTGIFGCKKILAKGKYVDGFEQSLVKYLKAFMK